jgi:hypothetical protein
MPTQFKKGQRLTLDIREALVDIAIEGDGVTYEDIIENLRLYSTNKNIKLTNVDIQKYTLEDKS